MSQLTAPDVPQGCMLESERLDRLVMLVEQGYASQLVLSSDTCRLSQMRGHGGRGFTFVLQVSRKPLLLWLTHGSGDPGAVTLLRCPSEDDPGAAGAG